MLTNIRYSKFQTEFKPWSIPTMSKLISHKKFLKFLGVLKLESMSSMWHKNLCKWLHKYGTFEKIATF